MMNYWKNTKVLITGGAGFIGSHLADRLLELGVKEIRIIDDLSRGRLENLSQALTSGRVIFCQDDIRNAEIVFRLARDCDYIFHLAAWRIHRCEAEPMTALEVMVRGTHNVLEAGVRAQVKKVIYASSASVYGQATQFPTPETYPPYANDTLYGWAKLMGEGLLKWYARKGLLSGTCLRFFNVYGPRMDTEGKYTEVIIRWMEALFQGDRPIIHGDGSASYDFVHVQDVIQALVLAARTGPSWGVYNVGTGQETSLRELARMLACLVGKPEAEPIFLAERAPSVYRRLACLEKIMRELGYKPLVMLPQGLSDLVRWYCEMKSREVVSREPSYVTTRG
ncbi:MAG: NAD-dependent epimerase/dehydratase family protein [Gemmatales bacterium]|nr:NAD-dependent epimerase/dehydratase family protein [Gemmatales bacterium]MDW8174131.1 NAD-dependent epimerase/dehydratase family protein [Gemmatales bacterium]